MLVAILIIGLAQTAVLIAILRRMPARDRIVTSIDVTTIASRAGLDAYVRAQSTVPRTEA